MALAERTPTAIRKGPPCTMGLLLAFVQPADRATLLEWLGDPRAFAGTWIADQLTDEFGESFGRIGADAVRRHRLHRCLCTVESS